MTARPERAAAEEVRQRMLDAGRELALEAGAALTIEHLRLEEVIQRARVPIVTALGHRSQVLGVRLRDPACTFDHMQLAGGLPIEALALRNVQVQTALDQPDGTAAPAAAPDSAARPASGG